MGPHFLEGCFLFCLLFFACFLCFLFLRRLFFVFVQILPISFSFLLYIFYSCLFSFLSFLVFFMLPLSIVFWLKTLLSVEVFFVVLLPILSYMSLRFFKPSTSLLSQ